MELDMRMSAVEKLREITNVTNKKLEEIFATFQDKMVRAIEEVFAEHCGSPPSRGTNGSETSESKVTREDLSPPRFQQLPEFQKEDEASRIVKPDVESNAGKEDKSADSQDGAGRKRQETGGEFGAKIEHLGPPPWWRSNSEGMEANPSKSVLGGMEALRIGDYTRRERDKKKARAIQEQDGVDHVVRVVDSHGTSDWRLHREELECEFEKMMKMAAREVSLQKAFWAVGFNRHEPVFLLSMSREKFRSEPGQILDPVDQPFRLLGGLEFERRGVEQKCVGLALVFSSPSPGPNTSVIKIGLISFQLSQGPKDKHEEEAEILSSKNIGLLLHLETTNFRTNRFEPPPTAKPPPPARPPPHPPDSLLNLSRLERLSIAAVLHETTCPIPLCISGKVDAAGIDPGDFPLRPTPPSPFIFHAIHSLEGKACLKRPTKAHISEGSHVEGYSFAPLPPPEPPPIQELIVKRHRQQGLRIIIWYGDPMIGEYTRLVSLSKQITTGCTMPGELGYVIVSSLGVHGNKLLEGEIHELDRMLILFGQLPRPLEFANDETDTQFQAEIELQRFTTNLLHFISLDRWDPKLNMRKTSRFIQEDRRSANSQKRGHTQEMDQVAFLHSGTIDTMPIQFSNEVNLEDKVV